MSKIVWLLIAATLLCKFIAGRWPWQLPLLSMSIHPAAATQARALLGVAPTAGRMEIVEAHKRLLFKVHPDRGGSEVLVHQANAARDLLLARLPQTPRT